MIFPAAAVEEVFADELGARQCHFADELFGVRDVCDLVLSDCVKERRDALLLGID